MPGIYKAILFKERKYAWLGLVGGIVIASSDDHGYATDHAEIDAVLGGVGDTPIDSGACPVIDVYPCTLYERAEIVAPMCSRPLRVPVG